MVKMHGVWPFRGTVVWLTPEQGGRPSGPPTPFEHMDFAVVAFVPPHTTFASFALRHFDAGAWTSPAEGGWLIVENQGEYRVEPGSVVMVADGPQIVAHFHVDRVIGDASLSSAQVPRSRAP